MKASLTTLSIIASPLVAVLSGYLAFFLGMPKDAAITFGIAVLTILYWVTEAIPIPVTSIIPFALLPLFNILTHREVASALGSHVILLLMGAFMLSKALEKSGVHQRLALNMLNLIGSGSQKRLIYGFMITTAALSMWISNTATILIMLPIALALLQTNTSRSFQVALILGIAYAASVGGLGTLIGTPPNVIFAGLYEEQMGEEFSFLQWMMIGIPIVILAIPLMAAWLSRNLTGPYDGQLPTPGNWRIEEKRALLLFGFAVVLWIFRNEPFGGWASLLGVTMSGDSTVALLAVVLMFIVPNGRGGKVLDWETAVSIPWGMLLLFAGGIALAKGFSASGLSEIIGQSLQNLQSMPLMIAILMLCLSVTFLTEITSNTATATLLMPILYLLGIQFGVDPAVLMIPAAMAASCAFMLPVATAPNAIAYGTGKIEIKEMIREGAVLSVLVSSLVGLIVYTALG